MNRRLFAALMAVTLLAPSGFAANLAGKDATGATKYWKATGTGTNDSGAYVQYHLLSTDGTNLASFGSLTPTATPAGWLNSLPFAKYTAAGITLTDGQTAPLQVNASGYLLTAPTGTQAVSGTFWQATQPVSLSSVPLATGAASATKQDTGNTSLSNIDGKTPALGQALAASSVPVVLTAAQLTTLTPPASVGITGTVPVSGTFWQATQPVSASALPLPTGAATETTLSALNTKTPALGQALAASSVPVVLTAAQLTTLTPLSSVGITGTPAVTVSGVAQDATLTGGSQIAQLKSGTKGTSTAALVTSTASGSNHQPLDVTLYDNAGNAVTFGSGGTSSTIGSAYPTTATAVGASDGTNMQALKVTAGGLLKTDGSGATQPISAASLPLPTGAATETTLASMNAKVTAVNTGAVTISAALPAGTALLGKVGIDQTTPGTTNKVNIGTDGTVAATQSGTWSDTVTQATAANLNATVAQGAANSTPWNVQSPDSTLAVSLTSTTSVTSGTLNGVSTVTVAMTSLGTGGTVQFEASADGGTTWVSVNGVPIPISSTTTSSTASTGTFQFNVAGMSNFRVRASAITSGTITGTARFSAAPMVALSGISVSVGNGVGTGKVRSMTDSAISGYNGTTLDVLKEGQTGVQTSATGFLDTIGLGQYNSTPLSLATTNTAPIAISAAAHALTDDNITQLNGTTVDTNSGTKSAGTLRVVLATDQPALTSKLLVTPDSVALPANQSVNVSQINGVTPLMGNGVTGTGSQRVTIASDNTAFAVNATLQTGSAVVGKVGIDQTTPGTTNAIQPIAGTSGGVTPYSLISAATTNATNVKASAGQVYYIALSNTSAASKYVRFFNKASAPTVGTDTPIMRIMVPAGGGYNVSIPDTGAAFGTGIAFDITGAAADNDTTAVAASDVLVNIGYK